MRLIATTILGVVIMLALGVFARESPASLPHCPGKDPDFREPDNMVRPKYPKDALAAGVEGVVELKAVISPDGKTENLSVVSGPPAFTKLSLNAVQKWRFYPMPISNVPKQTTYNVKISFNLILEEATPHVTLESPLPVAPPLPDTVPSITSTSDGPVYHVLKDAGTTQPKIIFQVDPEFSEDARKEKQSGDVEIKLVVGTDGLPHDLRPVCTDWPSLTEKALEAVRRWRFLPGTKDGKPVQVEIGVKVEFHLY
jgi:TonB family protein